MNSEGRQLFLCSFLSYGQRPKESSSVQGRVFVSAFTEQDGKQWNTTLHYLFFHLQMPQSSFLPHFHKQSIISTLISSRYVISYVFIFDLFDMNYKALYKVGNLHWVIISNVIIKSFKLNKSVVLLCLIIKQFQYNIRIQNFRVW